LKKLLNIITVTKDDYDGVINTVQSTRQLRLDNDIRQIIVDSSTEETRKKISEVLTHEENIDYVWQKPAGIASAFNEGLQRSDAEWVWFLNGRDAVHSSVDRDKLVYLLAQSRADAMIFEIELSRSHKRYSHPPLWNLWPPVHSWVPHPATLLRQRLFDQFGLFDETFSISMDLDLWFRFFSKNVIVDMISMPLTLYDEGGMSSTDTGVVGSEGMTIIKRNLRLMIRKWIGTGVLVYRAFRHYHGLGKAR
jgi:hypothetical protein